MSAFARFVQPAPRTQQRERRGFEVGRLIGPRAMWIAAVGLAALLAIGTIASRTGSAGASPAGHRVIHLTAQRDKFKIVRNGNIGGESLDRFQLTDPSNGKHVGTAYDDCVDTWAEQVLCHFTLEFLNQLPWGQISLDGTVSLIDPKHVVPVVGGTREFEGVRGQATWK